MNTFILLEKFLNIFLLLRRKDWHYYTTNLYQYAGKWLRSYSTGFGDGADYWEVFLLDDGTENIVSWDYNATLCFRESANINYDN